MKRLLLVDDESWFAKPLIRRIRRYGYHVVYHRNASDALELLINQKEEFHVLILDMMLPYGDIEETEQTEKIPGLYILKKLQEHDGEDQINKMVKIVYTVLEDKELIAKIEGYGADHYAKASIDDEYLLKRLKKDEETP